jgi:hypothetical protein
MSAQISPTSSAASQLYAQPQPTKQAPQPQPLQQQKTDSVSLSPQALSSGDVDHDGDSH